MATAKQLAARKRFAQMAKSGQLAKLRSKGKSKPRAKNPTPMPKIKRGTSPATGMKANPVRRAKRKMPLPEVTHLHGVFIAKADGTAGKLVGQFAKHSDAVQYAEAYANLHGVQVLV